MYSIRASRKFPPLAFSKGELVLCYHGPALYEAKILRCTNTGGGRYKVHFVGWSKKWDDWFPASKIMKLNGEGLKMQQNIFEKLSLASKSNKKAIDKIMKIKTVIAARRPRRHRRRKRASVENVDMRKGLSTSRNSRALVKVSKKIRKRKVQNRQRKSKFVRITTKSSIRTAVKPVTLQNQIPPTITEYLVTMPNKLVRCFRAEYNVIVNGGILQKLPAKVTISTIVDEYLHYRRYGIRITRTGITDYLMVKTTLDNLMNHFDSTFAPNMLYSYEYNQYMCIKKLFPSKKLSTLYGANHLTRLFNDVGLIKAMRLNKMEAKILEEFLNYVANNVRNFFEMN